MKSKSFATVKFFLLTSLYHFHLVTLYFRQEKYVQLNPRNLKLDVNSRGNRIHHEHNAAALSSRQ